MSTERKPGSRAVRNPLATGRKASNDPVGSEPGQRDSEKRKGSTKTVSRRDSFKKKRK